MYCKLKSYTMFGLEAEFIELEVSISPGLAKFEIIGLPDASIRESKERILQAIKYNGYETPPGNITVNLAPAEIRKKGTTLDLPIALGILIASAQVKSKVATDDLLIAGELSLKGELRSVSGIFNAALACLSSKIVSMIVPDVNIKALYYFKSINRVPARELKDAISFMESGQFPRLSPVVRERSLSKKREMVDYSQVYGNDSAKRALQLSVLAGLNILLIGPPGCGKTMLLKRLPTIMPELSEKDSIEVTGIHSAGVNSVGNLIRRPPFREVHSSVSQMALIGGGSSPTPGEISLAHKGVLFLDELSEFPRSHIQFLRTPIESKYVSVARIGYRYRFPADFLLAAATNPCPCGYYGDDYKMCSCSDSRIKQYYNRISGPIMDRIDIIQYINPVKTSELFLTSEKSSSKMREELSEPQSYVRTHPRYFEKENLDVVVDKYPFIKKITRDAYEKGYFSLRRLNIILKVSLACALLEGVELAEDHVYQGIEFCRFKW